MKGKELAGYLLENPDWNVQFLFMQTPDEIGECYDRFFDITDVGDRVRDKTTILLGEEHEERID